MIKYGVHGVFWPPIKERSVAKLLSLHYLLVFTETCTHHGTAPLFNLFKTMLWFQIQASVSS